MDDDACTPVTVTGTDGTRLTATPHGAHLTGWQPPGGIERLWLSPLARCGPGLALRGGVPVIFPQFAGRGDLPKHGIARDRPWALASAVDAEGAATLTATLRDDAQTRAIWPHPFALTLTARAMGPTLRLELTVANVGEAPFAFAAALHTYLAVGEAGAVIEGLAGLGAEDNAHPGATSTVPADALRSTATRDIAVRGTTGPVQLRDGAHGDLALRSENFEDVVVWNPGPDHRLDDVPAGAEAGFVCLEPAVLDAVLLNPAETWLGVMTLTVTG